MKYNPEIHHRHSIRLKGYDYSSNGAYFITICVKNRECIFGEIINGEMYLNDYGKIVSEEWLKTEKVRKNIIIDEFVIMPNHFHGIIIIDNSKVTVSLNNFIETCPVGASPLGRPEHEERASSDLGSGSE